MCIGVCDPVAAGPVGRFDGDFDDCGIAIGRAVCDAIGIATTRLVCGIAIGRLVCDATGIALTGAFVAVEVVTTFGA